MVILYRKSISRGVEAIYFPHLYAVHLNIGLLIRGNAIPLPQDYVLRLDLMGNQRISKDMFKSMQNGKNSLSLYSQFFGHCLVLSLYFALRVPSERDIC